MASAFGVDHGWVQKDELGDRREKKRKAKAKAFFNRPDISAQIDDVFRPAPARKISEDAGHGVSIRYRRPDGTTTNPKPKAVAPTAPKVKGSNKVANAVTAAGAGALGGAYLLHRKKKGGK